nr:glycosyl hydrolase family 28-related protein [Rhodococcus kroppenstedtii]
MNGKDFGAKGDGTTNDSAAIQAAIDYAAANSCSVYLPKANYRADGLLFRSGFMIYGDGREQSIITAVAGSANTFVFGIAEGITQHTMLKDIGIVAAGNAGQHEIHIWARRGTSKAGSSGLWHAKWDCVRVYNFAGAQIWFQGGGVDALDPIQIMEFYGMVVERRNDSAQSICVLMSGQVNQTTRNGGRMDAFGANSAEAAGVDLKICRQLNSYDVTYNESTTFASNKSGHTHLFNGMSFQQAQLAVIGA